MPTDRLVAANIVSEIPNTASDGEPCFQILSAIPTGGLISKDHWDWFRVWQSGR